MNDQLVLSMQNITKEFPGVKALDNVHFELQKGEVHAICGENGAGKSTLLKILNGMYQNYEGTIEINGNNIKFNSTKDARQKGLSIITQEIHLARELTVAENIFMGQYPKTKYGIVDWKKLIQKTVKLQEMLGYQAQNINPKEKVKELSIGRRQIVEILKAISFDIKILALDEPTSSLSAEESDQLFKLIKQLSARGISIIYVSHRLNEIFKMCDRVTVLKDGKYVGTREVAKIETGEIVSMMVGRNVQLFEAREYTDKTQADVALEVKDFCKEGVFKDINLKVHKGEIVGCFGIVGSGRTEVARAIFGVDKKTAGSLYVQGKLQNIRRPKDAVKHRIGFVTEDRHGQGLVLISPIRWNITMPFIKTFAKKGFIQFKEESQVSKTQMDALKIKAPSDMTLVKNLSGGNQQKVIIGRWLAANSDILIFDEPTRGIDVGTKTEIYKLLRQLAEDGKAIIMISSELPEIMGLSDRIYIFRDGQISGHFVNRQDLTDTDLLKKAIIN